MVMKGKLMQKAQERRDAKRLGIDALLFPDFNAKSRLQASRFYGPVVRISGTVDIQWKTWRNSLPAQKTTSRNPEPPVSGYSQNDAVVISSDNESEYGNFDDDQPDTSFPSVKELVRQPTIHRDTESGGLASADKGPDTTSGRGGSNGRELPVSEGADPGNELSSSQQQMTGGQERSPPAPALPRRSPTTGTLRAEQKQPAPVGIRFALVRGKFLSTGTQMPQASRTFRHVPACTRPR
ncbi:hypothetical protein B0T24DRAFT_667700 [Lasiosphaeria ovina]|uniref:Uncharacterized protein n=1 Tax=Lasiosphaeria ovina TaxID=92902 RepID=A0AAE0N5E4_9PEZI|nr:hypothetical protein B0T24DRAFT_667700 [Lasiosphaeria ovina]